MSHPRAPGRKIKYASSSFLAALQGRSLELQPETEAGVRAEVREGCRADNRHDLTGKGVHVDFRDLQKDTCGMLWIASRVTMLDRVGGGFSLLLHAPGFLPENQSLTPDNLVIDGYIPPREATNHRDALQEPINSIVEIFARDVALPYLRCAQEYYKASKIPRKLTHVSSPVSIALAPESGSSHIRFRPTTRLPLFEDEDADADEALSSYGRQIGWDALAVESLRMEPRSPTLSAPASSSSVQSGSGNVTVRPQRLCTRPGPSPSESAPPLQSSDKSLFEHPPTPAQRRSAFVPFHSSAPDSVTPTKRSVRNAFVSPGPGELPPLRFEPPHVTDSFQLRHRGTEALNVHREHDWDVTTAAGTSTPAQNDGQLHLGIEPITEGILKRLKVSADIYPRLRILAASHPPSEWTIRLQAPFYGLNANEATTVSVAIAADFGVDLASVVAPPLAWS
ncbi:hypothetical protein BC834DRAFT_974527 [Gloeopeniophorella convolvens]|nr:hypothetical protein BC834DRAFT_974527 [Gloeopeniophorella convolvens]